MSKFTLYRFYSKKVVVFVSLLFMILLVLSSHIFVANGTLVPDVVVGNEVELLNAVSAAPDKKSYIIGLSDDVVLKNSLEIPKNKIITLVLFGGASSFVCLIGSDGVDTIIVKSGGELVLLDGIVVTHVKGNNGRGVCVERKGTLILFDCEISGNTVNDVGGGVYNQGTFKMHSGKISGNTVIIDNVIYGCGGGVYNTGSFVMSNGVISNNTASIGGGVYNDVDGSFVMSGGEITYNTASIGGGVYYFSGSVKGTFTMTGGTIFSNTVTTGGDSNFSETCVDSAHFYLLYLLFIVIAVIVVMVLLVYRSKRLKQSNRPLGVI